MPKQNLQRKVGWWPGLFTLLCSSFEFGLDLVFFLFWGSGLVRARPSFDATSHLRLFLNLVKYIFCWSEPTGVCFETESCNLLASPASSSSIKHRNAQLKASFPLRSGYAYQIHKYFSRFTSQIGSFLCLVSIVYHDMNWLIPWGFAVLGEETGTVGSYRRTGQGGGPDSRCPDYNPPPSLRSDWGECCVGCLCY